MVHRGSQNTSNGLITKGDNNPEPDQYQGQIARTPITQQCLEGKVVFVIPYVELLAYYVDAYGLPQWLNYLPSILILIVVFFSVLRGDEDEKEPQAKAAAIQGHD